MTELTGDALEGWKILLSRLGMDPARGETVIVKLDSGDQVAVTDTSVQTVASG